MPTARAMHFFISHAHEVNGPQAHVDILRSHFTHTHAAQSCCELKRFSSLSEIPGQLVQGQRVEVEVAAIALSFRLEKNEKPRRRQCAAAPILRAFAPSFHREVLDRSHSASTSHRSPTSYFANVTVKLLANP